MGVLVAAVKVAGIDGASKRVWIEGGPGRHEMGRGEQRGGGGGGRVEAVVIVVIEAIEAIEAIKVVKTVKVVAVVEVEVSWDLISMAAVHGRLDI